MSTNGNDKEEMSAREARQGETRGHMRIVVLISVALAVFVGIVLMASY